MPQFDSSTFTSQIFWLVVNFSLLVFFIVKFYFPRLKNTLSTRNALLNESVEGVEPFISEKEKILKESHETLMSARLKASQLIRKNLEETEHHKTVEIMKFDEQALNRSKKIYKALEAGRREEAAKIGDASQTLVKDILHKILPPAVSKDFESKLKDQDILQISNDFLKKHLMQKEG